MTILTHSALFSAPQGLHHALTKQHSPLIKWGIGTVAAISVMKLLQKKQESTLEKIFKNSTKLALAGGVVIGGASLLKKTSQNSQNSQNSKTSSKSTPLNKSVSDNRSNILGKMGALLAGITGLSVFAGTATTTATTAATTAVGTSILPVVAGAGALAGGATLVARGLAKGKPTPVSSETPPPTISNQERIERIEKLLSSFSGTLANSS